MEKILNIWSQKSESMHARHFVFLLDSDWMFLLLCGFVSGIQPVVHYQRHELEILYLKKDAAKKSRTLNVGNVSHWILMYQEGFWIVFQILEKLTYLFQ